MGSRYADWVIDSVKQIATERYEENGRFGWPSAKKVQAVFFEEHGQEQLISDRWISEIIRELKIDYAGPSDIDGPWSLGKSDEARIPDEATGAILKVWAWSITDESAEPVTIRMARWISKLRWVKDAGGSDYGVVTNLHSMYFSAAMYAGRERMVELIRDKKNKTEKEKKGMRSGVLDAIIMLDSEIRMFASSLGLLENDTGISLPLDLSLAAPQFKADLDRRYPIGTEDVSAADAKKEWLLDERLAGLPAHAKVMLKMAMKKLKGEAPKMSISDSQHDNFEEELLQDMRTAYQAGDMYSWNPTKKITALLYPNRRGRKKA